MNKKSLALVLGIVGTLQAETQASLSPSQKTPKIDGAIEAGEYEYTTKINGMNVSATLGLDEKLYVAVEAPTSGWVALGTGSLVMSGSRLYFGAVRDGRPTFSEMTAAGHGAVPAKSTIALSWAVNSSGGSTRLELAVPSREAMSDGVIKIIFSYAASPDFRVKHRARGALSFTIT